MVSNTGSSPPGELLMTCRTSEVAVCWASDSRSSLSKRVLDGDDGLVSKILDQFNLLVGERTDFLTVNGDHPNQLVLLEHWNSEIGPSAGEFDQGDDGIIALDIRLFSPEVGDVDHLLGSGEAG